MVELEVAGLVKQYSPQVTIGPISFEVTEGEFFSLLGPSGCGKTTTLRCIAGFERPSEGRITLSGRRLDDMPPHRRDVGLVFQNYALFPHLTVFENIAFGLRLRRIGRKEVEERVGRMLELVGLPNLAGRYPPQLSGGQQQRIAIARSLVLEPRLLLFDEPLSNLDFKLRVQMRFELRELQRRLGKTSIYVTHDQTEALALSDRIAVLSQGRIEQIGRPSEIYETPETAFVADFIGSSNILDATVQSKSGVGASVRTGSGLELTVPPVVEEIGSRLLILVRPERIRLVDGREEAVSNRITAEIDDLTYLGEDVQLRVTTAPAAKLLVALKSGKGTRELRRGGSIDLAIDPEDIHVLRK
ncbi:MAG: ABC transporter ATP-binding protein [Proteobacteria bacterium]|nr:ABC transporter ATP-binding protein [Pseudomonadota bacterium]